MEHTKIWLIDHKATLSENSPMNMDGSSWILGVCVLGAPDQQSAMSKFADFLQNEEMSLIETYDIREYHADDFTDGSDRTDQINYAIGRVKQDGETCYVYARTSETMESIDEETGND